ncbi:MAG TPA: TolC family outer membrane protein [Polaromonas sp.]|uniref:TolC family outer membrane protein n=1 Tax=Polaromonas sp. TaxID=1869339 RepID=UPI002D33A778|nr:TolC family outer membrane protein [Polaromonas sp.]HYW58143.1 TolC family outer membrane protein [Polaromonas sp.]
MTSPSKKPDLLPLSLALSAVLAVFAPAVQAQNLVELYRSARDYDASYQSSRSLYEANLAKAAQAKAGILPTAGLSAGATRTNQETTVITPAASTTTDRRFSGQTATLSASQPLYRPGNWATYEQGKQQVVLSKAQLDAADQDLIVRTSQAYFDVLASQDTLTFVRAQKAAVGEQLASAKRNFEVGTSTITDSREAQARFDLVVAQEIAAENDLRVKKIALDQLVGRSDAMPRGLQVPLALPPLVPGDVNAWVQQSEDVHPTIRQAQASLEVAKLEVDKAEAGHKPTLDLTASYGAQRNPNGSSTSGQNTRSNASTVGLSFNLPIFAGFATQNRIRETLSLEDKARTDLEGAKRNVALATRTAYFGVQSGQGQVKALEAAEASSQSSLDANKLGYQVGVRINIDVLNAQSQLFQTKRDLAKARYDVLVGGLKLRQANGTLTPEDLLLINSLLVK